MNYLKNNQITALVIFRIFIGWHFLFEGVTKLYNPAWTSKAYLVNATGPFREFFVWLSGDGMITAVDYLNMIGLVAIGLALILGVAERAASIGGIVLLMFYYLSQPPFPGIEQIGTEGNYLFINKNLIEAAGLLALYYFPTGYAFGVQRLLHKSPKSQLN